MTKYLRLYEIKSNYFTAGIEIFDGEVACTPSIVKYMCGWPLDKVRRYCEEKGWTFGALS